MLNTIYNVITFFIITSAFVKLRVGVASLIRYGATEIVCDKDRTCLMLKVHVWIINLQNCHLLWIAP